MKTANDIMTLCSALGNAEPKVCDSIIHETVTSEKFILGYVPSIPG